jgi:hypothetical protein
MSLSIVALTLDEELAWVPSARKRGTRQVVQQTKKDIHSISLTPLAPPAPKLQFNILPLFPIWDQLQQKPTKSTKT